LPCDATASLAQLAEQRTLNQYESGKNAEKTGTSSCSAAHSAAVDPENGAIDPDLRFIVERWSELSEPIKAGILAMVRAADPSLGRILSGVKTGEKPSHPEESRSEPE